MDNNNLPGLIESLLFLHGEPLTIAKLAHLAEVQETEIISALEKLSARLKESGSGLALVRTDDEVQLVTHPDLAAYTEKLIKDDFDATLTPAALETLTIICYLGPVSRAQVDLVRGVNSSFILRSLLLRGLITRRPDNARRYIYLYEPTPDLLRFLGLSAVSDLPDYNQYHKLLNDASSTNSASHAE